MLKFEKIKGLIDAPFTPMLENGDVNLEAIGFFERCNRF